MSLLTDLDAFDLDHRKCGGELRAGVDDRGDGAAVWIECDCSARIVGPVAAPPLKEDTA